jgi:hypothetical protein
MSTQDDNLDFELPEVLDDRAPLSRPQPNILPPAPNVQTAVGERIFTDPEQQHIINLQGQVAQAQMPQQPAILTPPAGMPLQQNPQSQTGQQGNPHVPVAEDGDLIEKEWVTKAKEIVARTRSDPYQQNKQLSLMKVDYLQKRYGKSVKTPEGGM